MSRLRIGLYGLYGVRNLGNEATLAATIAALRARAPDCELILISSPPAPDAGLPALATIERLPHELRTAALGSALAGLGASSSPSSQG